MGSIRAQQGRKIRAERTNPGGGRGTNTGWLTVDTGTGHHGRDHHRDREGVVNSALASHPPLTAVDRCDRCGAQAYIRVTLTTGGELLFCAHHGRAHEARLREMSVAFHDETSALVSTPHVAPDTER
jgi:hypothetical protein